MSDTEKSLLGALLQDPAGLSRARARLGAGSFASQECALVWDALCRLTDEAQHVDLVTVTGKLANMGLLDSAGGAAGVAGLLDRAGDPDQTDSYVSLIDESAARRGLITLGNRLLSAAEANQDPWKLMASHKDDLDKLSAKRADSKVINSATLTDRTDKFIEAAAQLGGRMPGVSTGFSEVDSITGGMQKSDLVVVGARPAQGKALENGTPVLTPSGFVHIEELAVGDVVYGQDGKETIVTGVFPQGECDIYKVTFSDRTWVNCTEDHLWETSHRFERDRGESSIKTTKQIMETLRAKGGTHANHSVKRVEPICYSERVLPLHPYVMGVWLGDGSLTKEHGSTFISDHDLSVKTRCASLLPAGDVFTIQDHIMRIRGARHGTGSVMSSVLISYGLNGKRSWEKFIPEDYLRGSVQQREELLAGLVDTDGHVAYNGTTIEYTTTSEVFAYQILDLVRGLGGRASINNRVTRYTSNGEKKDGRRSWRLHFSFANSVYPVRSELNVGKFKQNTKSDGNVAFVETVEFVRRDKATCIRVSAPDGLFVTKDYIVTHNSSAAVNLAHAACSNRKRVAFFSLEMSAVQVGMRFRSIDACVDLQRLRFGLVNEYERLQLDNSSARMRNWHLFVDDSSSLTVQEIRSKCSLIKANGGLDLIVVDYVQIMGGISADNTAYNIGASMYGLKALAKELDCCVVALAQLNRKSEQDDREPVLSDLKGSGGLEEAADVVILLHREQETKDVACHWIVAKQRNGPTGKVTLGWNAPIASFTNVTVVEEHLTE